MLTGKGVTAWRNAITGLTPPARRPPPADRALPGDRPAAPAALTAELISALAGLVLAGTAP